MPGSDYERKLKVAVPTTVQIMSEEEKKAPLGQGRLDGWVRWAKKQQGMGLSDGKEQHGFWGR